MKYLRFILPILVLYATACKHEQETKQEQTTFIVTHPMIKDTVMQHEYVCQIRSYQHIELRALKKGYPQDIYVDEGQMVKKGQMLFQIMPLVYQAEEQKVLAELYISEFEYQSPRRQQHCVQK